MTHREQDIDFFLKQGDTDPAIQSTLSDADGDIDLRNISEVRFQMRHIDSTETTVDESAEVLDADDGIVAYAWQDGDTASLGLHLAEWEVTYPDGSTASVPNDGFIRLYVSPSLD